MAAAVLLATAACTQLDVAGPADVPALTSFGAAKDPDRFLVIDATWDAPKGLGQAGQDLGIEIQVQVPDGTLLTTIQLPATAGQATFDLPYDTPDGALLELRARYVAWEAGMASPFAPPVTVQHGVRAPSDLYVQRGDFGPSPPTTLGVSWRANSAQVDGLRVERRLRPYAGTPGAWQALPAPATTSTSYLDEDVAAWRDGAAYEYRVTNLVGAVESPPATGQSPPGRPLDPVASAALVDGATHLSWTYPGQAPVNFLVWREAELTARAELARPATGASGHLDLAPPPGVWRYGVQAHLASSDFWAEDTLSDASVGTVVSADPAWAGRLKASLVTLPAAAWVVRDGAGRFAVAWKGDAGLTVRLQEGSGTASWSIPSGNAALWERAESPPIAFDPADRLHVFWEHSAGLDGAFWSLRHRWREAGAWQEETSGIIGAPGVAPALPALDASGAPVLAWQDFATGPGMLPITLTSRRTGTWVAESVPAPWDADTLVSAPFATPAGEVGLLTAGHTSMHLLRRTAAGWTGEDVPSELGGITFGQWRTFFLPSADRAITGFAWPTSLGLTDDYWVKLREPSGWQPAEKALTCDWTSTFAMAATPDGGRVAVACTGSGGDLALREGGVWRPLPLAGTKRGVTLGFTSAGKLWVLTGLSTFQDAATGADVTYVLYEEP